MSEPEAATRSELEAPGDSELLDAIETFARQRNSGFAFPDEMGELEKELVMLWDETVEDYERALRLRMMVSLEVLTRVGGVH